MGIKNVIISLVKKVRCKCKCLGSIEIEIRPSDSPIETPSIENTNNNNLNVENSISINSPQTSPRQSPVTHRSPQPLPRPHIYTELI